MAFSISVVSTPISQLFVVIATVRWNTFLSPLPNATRSRNLGNRCKMKCLPATVPIWTKRQKLPSSPTPNVRCFGTFCGSPGLPAAHHGGRGARSFVSLPHDDASIMKERGQCLQDEYIAESALDICHAVPGFLRLLEAGPWQYSPPDARSPSW